MNIDRWLVDTMYISVQTGVSGSGVPQYSTSSAIACRVEKKINQDDSNEDSQLVSNTQIMTKEEISKHDMLWLNKTDADNTNADKLQEVLEVEMVKDINGDFTLYKLYV